MRILIYFMMVVSVLAGACSKDKGNYDYTKINKISIDNMLLGDHNSQRIYRVVNGDPLNFTPVITGTVSGSDTTNLRFAWVIEKDTIARTKELHTIANMGFGKLVGYYFVKDLTTNTVYTYNFTLEISNAASRGTYILAEDADHNAILYMHSALSVNNLFRPYSAFNDKAIGKYPVDLGLKINYGNSSTNYTYTVMTAARESDANVMEVFVNEMKPILFYNKSSFIEPSASFNITQYVRLVSATHNYILVDGKAHLMNKGAIGSVLYPGDPQNYDFGAQGLFTSRSLYSRLLAGWDYRNNKVRILMTANQAASDSYITSAEGPLDQSILAGYTFIKGFETSINGGFCYVFLMKKGDKLASFLITLNGYQSVNSLTKIAEATVPDLDKMIMPYFNFSNNFWYFAIGRSVYRTTVMGMELQKVFTLPEDQSGDIAAFAFNEGGTVSMENIGVCTYDPNSSKAMKGSFYLFNTVSNSFTETHLNVIQKPVAIQMGF
ncbi:hypothetical protein HHL16_21940 [Pseudoflavitalea sp. G-6-1-2]|uniref:PKD-like family lipoprotein n=1 Tax=Pseudoflavitalea sp. G-6-1-2 TaxID=2728841 RepID=UPI00146BB381|nr:PKD-like family lipoprotein [Pseudoflavitalea sp. G-6-1-2]NML23556.1 hypothetical protein [Pseudoflavitalea sp. G-6-1-2]